MIVASLVFVALLTVIVAAWRLNAAVDSAHERFRVLLGGYGDADLLAAARQRFRERQRRVEAALDTGAAGLKSAHSGLSRLITGERRTAPKFYDRMRAFNRGFGRAVSGLFAPGPRRRSETLAQWRARKQAEDAHDADDER